MFVIKDKTRTNPNYMYLNIKDTKIGQAFMTNIDECKKYSSLDEAKQEFKDYQAFWNKRGERCDFYEFEEIQEEHTTKSQEEYYVLRKDEYGNKVYRTSDMNFPSIYLDNALKFDTIQYAINYIKNNDYEICKVVETTVVQKIDHQKELKKLEKEKLQKEKDSLTAKLKEINDKLQKIS